MYHLKFPSFSKNVYHRYIKFKSFMSKYKKSDSYTCVKLCEDYFKNGSIVKDRL